MRLGQLIALQDRIAVPSSTGLTTREREVLRLIASGVNTKSIASRLYLSAKTVESHRANIMKKLKLDNIVDLVKWALRNGFGDICES